MADTDRPVVAVANRLPVHHGDEGWELSPGGLVTALRPVMATHPGAWVGWDGGAKGMPATLPDSGVRLLPVGLSAAQVRNYYHGFANATLWPLLHNAIEKPRFERAWWRAYHDVNSLFSERAVVALDAHPGAIAWIHDYHLMLLPQLLRAARGDNPIGFFLHVPWPSPDIFARLPWREQILMGLLGADLVAFHTERYQGNFLRSCARLLAESGVEVRGSWVALPDGRKVATATAPISIDAAEFTRYATAPGTGEDIEALREQFRGRALLLGVDRLDYTKGIIERVLAVEMLLERNPELRTSLAFLQIAVPSRDDVREYRQLRATVEQHVGRINGRFTEPGTDVPVHYLYRGLSQQQLAAYYATADALLVTPLIDGMNLVCKEYVTVQQARGCSGALVLSEFTGAAFELPQAVMCNPFDVEGLSYRIEHALRLAPLARQRAMAEMADHVRRHDVYQWVDGQLAAITARALRLAAQLYWRIFSGQHPLAHIQWTLSTDSGQRPLTVGGAVMTSRMTPLLERNEQFARTYTPVPLGMPAAQVMVVTCLDHRVDPAITLGLGLGDAPVLRNAGGRVTQPVIEEIAYLAFLGRKLFAGGGQLTDDRRVEVAVIHHTQCGTGFLADPGFRREASAATGVDEAALEASAVSDPYSTVSADVDRLLASPLLPPRLGVSGYVYDLETGRVTTVVDTRYSA